MFFKHTISINSLIFTHIIFIHVSFLLYILYTECTDIIWITKNIQPSSSCFNLQSILLLAGNYNKVYLGVVRVSASDITPGSSSVEIEKKIYLLKILRVFYFQYSYIPGRKYPLLFPGNLK